MMKNVAVTLETETVQLLDRWVSEGKFPHSPGRPLTPDGY